MELINATLLVQGIHFLIAYGVLKKMVFAPAVSVVQREQAEQDRELRGIEQALLDVQASEKQNKDIWQECHQRVAEKIPSQKKRQSFIFKGISLELVPPHITDTELADLKKDLSKTIVRLVDHVE